MAGLFGGDSSGSRVEPGKTEGEETWGAVPFVVTAWQQTEAVVVRQMLHRLGGQVCPGCDLHPNPWASLVPQPIVDDHGSVNLSNAFIMAVRGPSH